MAKRAKRATRSNPREDRNFSREEKFQRNDRAYKTRDNVVSVNFASSPKKKSVDIIPRNLNQETLVASLENAKKHIVFAVGPAGCGKTLLATMAAVKALKEGVIERIVITRPNVAVDDNDIGYLPGDILKKMMPWMMPIIDVFSEYYTQKEITTMLEENTIEIVPVAYIRGRTFKNCYILFDEAQNSTPTSMLSVLTRIGENSKLIVTGDVRQGDRGLNNGLSDVIRRMASHDPVHIDLVEFDDRDVERHPVIKEVLKMYKDMKI